MGGARAVGTASHPALRPSVILIREWEQQMSSSGCCGRIEGDLLGGAGGRVFAERRRAMEAMGPLYRAVRERFGDAVDLLVVDPRNMIAWLPRVLRDFVRYRVRPAEAVRTLSGVSTVAVVVNGRLHARGTWPDPAAFVASLTALAGTGRGSDALG
jgi:hypothetical protein